VRLDFSLAIKTQNSPVPCLSLCHAPVACTPTAIWTVIRHPPDLSQRCEKTLVLTVLFGITTLDQLFTLVQLHDTYLTDYSAFSTALSTMAFDHSTQWRFEICT